MVRGRQRLRLLPRETGGSARGGSASFGLALHVPGRTSERDGGVSERRFFGVCVATVRYSDSKGSKHQAPPAVLDGGRGRGDPGPRARHR